LTYSGGNQDIFVVKYDSSGNVLWAKSEGGASQEWGNGISSDVSGNVFVTGIFGGTSITFGATTLIPGGSDDIFVVKYDPSGNVLWAKSAGGANSDFGKSISTDVSGNVIVTGYFWSPSITFGATTLTNVGTGDVFVVKLDPLGNVLWAKSAGGINEDRGYGISTDSNGNTFVTGTFGSPTLTFGTNTLTNTTSSWDIFTVKYDPSGNVLWAQSEGGSGSDIGQSICSDINGNSYVTGYFNSPTITFGTNSLVSPITNYGNIFVIKFDQSGNILWAKSAGGTPKCRGYGIASSLTENIYVTGSVAGSLTTFETTSLISAGGDDIFVAKLDGTTGINEWNIEENTAIYPNPSNGIFNIDSNERLEMTDELNIFNLMGKKIYSSNMHLPDVLTIDISSQPNGIYLLQIKKEKGIVSKKIIINK
jgi:hypothetical protein